ncbi:MAG: ispE [Sphingobacteriaceae bacterium]|jgi:4-diphosphocytidyl-2-C-methyl-D-erythritol kinase|nr:ispE [Sphingobacteriaceae bacterium]
MIAFPNAKINLGLNIVSRRNDGYHDIQTVFYPVKVRDAVEVVESDALKMTFSGISVPGNPDENLCLKAYHLIKQDFELPPVHIHLHKHIPIGAGLGGGSADAAFFIALLKNKFNLNLTVPQMEAYARQLGADCAFFLHNKPMFAFGRGDEFEDVSVDLSAYHIALVMPPVHVPTAQAYAGVKPKATEIGLREILASPVKEWRQALRNDFEDSVFKVHPQIRQIKNALYESGALYASMSGSGASVYGIFDHKPDLRELEKHNLIFYGV